MKVSEIVYKRYTIEEGKAAFEAFKVAVGEAKCADDVIAAREGFMEAMKLYSEAASLSHCRFTLDTRNEFYQAEMSYYDEVGPLFAELSTAYADLMLESPYRAELEEKLRLTARSLKKSSVRDASSSMRSPKSPSLPR